MQNDKKAILITGAMGGLGKALIEMSRNLKGIDHIIATDNQAEIAELYKEDVKVIGFAMDVGIEISINKVSKHLQENGISVKYLVNCAGVSIFHPVSESTEELLDRTLKVNTYGPILTVSVFLDDLIKNKGRVIQISSVSVKLPTLFQPYPNSKIAMEAFSNSMRQELKFHGIDLVIIRPGAMHTRMTEEMNSLSNPIDNSKYQPAFETFVEIARQNIGKVVDPEKVTNLVKKVLLAKKPKTIYHINRNRKIRLMQLIPGRFRDWVIVNTLKRKL
jgi:NAD(P)-dependent dehydrogenase (short-subunit alcohol dehydrogenase family)